MSNLFSSVSKQSTNINNTQQKSQNKARHTIASSNKNYNQTENLDYLSKLNNVNSNNNNSNENNNANNTININAMVDSERKKKVTRMSMGRVSFAGTVAVRTFEKTGNNSKRLSVKNQSPFFPSSEIDDQQAAQQQQQQQAQLEEQQRLDQEQLQREQDELLLQFQQNQQQQIVNENNNKNFFKQQQEEEEEDNDEEHQTMEFTRNFGKIFVPYLKDETQPLRSHDSSNDYIVDENEDSNNSSGSSNESLELTENDETAYLESLGNEEHKQIIQPSYDSIMEAAGAKFVIKNRALPTDENDNEITDYIDEDEQDNDDISSKYLFSNQSTNDMDISRYQSSINSPLHKKSRPSLASNDKSLLFGDLLKEDESYEYDDDDVIPQDPPPSSSKSYNNLLGRVSCIPPSKSNNSPIKSIFPNSPSKKLFPNSPAPSLQQLRVRVSEEGDLTSGSLKDLINSFTSNQTSNISNSSKSNQQQEEDEEEVSEEVSSEDESRSSDNEFNTTMDKSRIFHRKNYTNGEGGKLKDLINFDENDSIADMTLTLALDKVLALGNNQEQQQQQQNSLINSQANMTKSSTHSNIPFQFGELMGEINQKRDEINHLKDNSMNYSADPNITNNLKELYENTTATRNLRFLSRKSMIPMSNHSKEQQSNNNDGNGNHTGTFRFSSAINPMTPSSSIFMKSNNYSADPNITNNLKELYENTTATRNLRFLSRKSMIPMSNHSNENNDGGGNNTANFNMFSKQWDPQADVTHNLKGLANNTMTMNFGRFSIANPSLYSAMKNHEACDMSFTQSFGGGGILSRSFANSTKSPFVSQQQQRQQLDESQLNQSTTSSAKSIGYPGSNDDDDSMINPLTESTASNGTYDRNLLPNFIHSQHQLQEQQLHQKYLQEQQEQLKQEQLHQQYLQQQEQEKLKQEQLRLEQLRLEQLKQLQIQEQEKLRQDQLKQEQLRLEQLKQEQLRQEQLKKEQLKQETLKREQLKQEQLKQEQLRQEQLKEEKLKQSQHYGTTSMVTQIQGITESTRKQYTHSPSLIESDIGYNYGKINFEPNQKPINTNNILAFDDDDSIGKKTQPQKQLNNNKNNNNNNTNNIQKQLISNNNNNNTTNMQLYINHPIGEISENIYNRVGVDVYNNNPTLKESMHTNRHHQPISSMDLEDFTNEKKTNSNSQQPPQQLPLPSPYHQQEIVGKKITLHEFLRIAHCQFLDDKTSRRDSMIGMQFTNFNDNDEDNEEGCGNGDKQELSTQQPTLEEFKKRLNSIYNSQRYCAIMMNGYDELKKLVSECKEHNSIEESRINEVNPPIFQNLLLNSEETHAKQRLLKNIKSHSKQTVKLAYNIWRNDLEIKLHKEIINSTQELYSSETILNESKKWIERSIKTIDGNINYLIEIEKTTMFLSSNKQQSTLTVPLTNSTINLSKHDQLNHANKLLEYSKQFSVFLNWTLISLDEKSILLQHNKKFTVHSSFVQGSTNEINSAATKFTLLPTLSKYEILLIEKSGLAKQFGSVVNIGQLKSLCQEVSNTMSRLNKLVKEITQLETMYNIDVNDHSKRLPNHNYSYKSTDFKTVPPPHSDKIIDIVIQISNISTLKKVVLDLQIPLTYPKGKISYAFTNLLGGSHGCNTAMSSEINQFNQIISQELLTHSVRKNKISKVIESLEVLISC